MESAGPGRDGASLSREAPRSGRNGRRRLGREAAGSLGVWRSVTAQPHGSNGPERGAAFWQGKALKSKSQSVSGTKQGREARGRRKPSRGWKNLKADPDGGGNLVQGTRAARSECPGAPRVETLKGGETSGESVRSRWPGDVGNYVMLDRHGFATTDRARSLRRRDSGGSCGRSNGRQRCRLRRGPNSTRDAT